MKRNQEDKTMTMNYDNEIVHSHSHSHGHGHSHSHSHGHSHSHSHSHVITTLNRAFIIGIVLNIAYVLAEGIAGLCFHSLGLLSDAGHNLTDVASLVMALVAFKLAGVVANRHYTYGYKKSTILISLLNALVLGVVVVFIIIESVQKLIHPQPIQGQVISIVAAIGVVVNGFTAYLFMKDQKKDLNVKGAYLHMLADTLVSLGVVASGIVIYFTDWYIIDPLIGLVVAVVIIFASWDLLRDSIRLALDGVPSQIDTEHVQSLMEQHEGVSEIHHLHIWALSTTENALTAHVVVENLADMQSVKTSLKAKLKEAGISHATLEFETPDAGCCKKCE